MPIDDNNKIKSDKFRTNLVFIKTSKQNSYFTSNFVSKFYIYILYI